MKKLTFLTLLLASTLISLDSSGQIRQQLRGGEPRDGGERGERVKTLKIGMITEELKLSESQAEKFWPVYNAYDSERMALHRQIRQKTKSASNAASDDEVLRQQDEVLELKEKEIELVKQYRGSFLKVISTKQYADLLETERKFNQMLMDKLKERGKH